MPEGQLFCHESLGEASVMGNMELLSSQTAESLVIPAQPNHLDGIVSCHMMAFPNQFLTLLGKGFLQCFYLFYIVQRGGICLVGLDDEKGQVLGLVTGGEPELRLKFLRRHFLRFILTACTRSFAYERVRARLLEHLVAGARALARKFRLVSGNSTFQPEPELPPGTWSNLLSICVDPKAQGRGVGKALMEAFKLESQRRGYKAMRLSVHNDNDSAIALYRKSGWEAILVTASGTYFKKSLQETG